MLQRTSTASIRYRQSAWRPVAESARNVLFVDPAGAQRLILHPSQEVARGKGIFAIVRARHQVAGLARTTQRNTWAAESPFAPTNDVKVIVGWSGVSSGTP
jgi:hypothetical protein